MRLFISIPLPKTIRKNLAEVKRGFFKFPAKWVEEENLHITLVFIGEMGGAGKLGEICGILSRLDVESIDLKTDRLVLLPNNKKAHVLAVELTGETDKLTELAERTKKPLKEKEINVDEKPFRPHVTLARIKKLRAGERRVLKDRVKNYGLPELEFEVNKIELVESQLTPTGPIYKAIEATDLCERC